MLPPRCHWILAKLEVTIRLDRRFPWQARTDDSAPTAGARRARRAHAARGAPRPRVACTGPAPRAPLPAEPTLRGTPLGVYVHQSPFHRVVACERWGPVSVWTRSVPVRGRGRPLLRRTTARGPQPDVRRLGPFPGSRARWRSGRRAASAVTAKVHRVRWPLRPRSC